MIVEDPVFSGIDCWSKAAIPFSSGEKRLKNKKITPKKIKNIYLKAI